MMRSFRLPPNFKEDISLVKRIFKDYVTSHKKSLIVILALMVFVAGLSSLYAYLLQHALDKIFINKDKLLLLLIPIAIIAVGFFKNAGLFVQNTMMNVVMGKMSNSIKNDIYRKFIYSDLAIVSKTSTGDIITACVLESEAIVNGVNIISTILVRELLTVVFVLGMLFYKNTTLALLSMIGFPLSIYPIILISRRLRIVMNTSQEKIAGFTTLVDDTMKSPKVLRAYLAEQFEMSRMSTVLMIMLKLRRKIAVLSNISGPLVEFFGSVSFAVIVWYGGWQVIHDKTTAGVFFGFIVAVAIAYKPFKSLTGINLAMQSFFTSLKRFYTNMDVQNSIIDKSNATILSKQNNIFDINFSNVTFCYPNVQDPSLKDVSFSVKYGKTIAFVGKTGAGKSTIVNLLLRFYDVTSGSISIGGVDIRDVTITSLRENIGYVGQDVMLFDDTIRRNISYTKENVSDNEIKRVAKLAHVDEFVEDLPLGYETPVGQGGSRLSGGQKQRIIIARAMLYDKPILILDEATSALDSISEKYIKESLETLMKNRTSIIIAHRMSTIRNADLICVVDHGTIVETGSHNELITIKNGYYSTLYNTQYFED